MRIFFCSAFFLLLFFGIATAIFGQDVVQETPSLFLLPFGYDFLRFEENAVHNPALGVGFLSGEQDIPFDKVDRRFFGLALYRPLIFTTPPFEIPKYIHQIETLFDGRIQRHQLLFIFKSSSDKPVYGGLHTFQGAAGWGYEIVRKPQMSLILGGVIAVTDFGITLPSGAAWPVLPLPFIRFGIDTQWFALSFDFLTGPNLEFTVAPKERIRFTADMRMDYYRSITDLIYEFTLWYRLFTPEHKLGDFAGIGLGVKNDSMDFTLANNMSFELQQTSVFAVVDLSLVKIQGGWIFDSRYITNDQKNGSPGSGFFVSIQGIIPINLRQ
uniref:Uncharacterized protein n=1 Tax=uncultured bacterium contig00068 TaxID=1181549 RepID=A0A806KNG6_9BACT|nr:hypothetical protein [uncultured bacterium contig00068]